MSEKKKLLGLNFGRANGNCKKFLNKAIESAKAENPEVEIEVIDCMKLKITHCIGCGACSRMLQSGKGQISCIQKDDFEALSDKVLEADAIIVAAPVYVLEATGIELIEKYLFKTSKEEVFPPRLQLTIEAPTFMCFEKGVE